jgi:hypothetical protein
MLIYQTGYYRQVIKTVLRRKAITVCSTKEGSDCLRGARFNLISPLSLALSHQEKTIRCTLEQLALSIVVSMSEREPRTMTIR